MASLVTKRINDARPAGSSEVAPEAAKKIASALTAATATRPTSGYGKLRSIASAIAAHVKSGDAVVASKPQPESGGLEAKDEKLD
jgi:hypothetical protein